MKKGFLFGSVLLLLIVFGCNNKQQNNQEKEQAEESENVDLQKGFQLTEQYCFNCHSANADIDDRVAPPMIAIKKHYIGDNTTEEEFIDDLIGFVSQPSKEKSKMPGALEKFGLMPNMGFNQEDLVLIAQYIYRTEIEQPDWFEKHYKEEQKKYAKNGEEELSYVDKGKQYALSTKAVLGKNLMGALNTLGTDEALAFCNTKAIHLTDSMALENGVKIKRVSDMNRNPENKATGQELVYITNAKKILASGQDIKPDILEMDDKVIGYYPIITNEMCMQCHGKANEEVKESTIAKLNELYPEDKALGYGVNELRGIWVVEMEK